MSDAGQRGSFSPKIARLFSLRDSIIRRSLSVFLITVPALFFQYFLLVYASNALSIEAFGIFYLAISLLGILFAPVPLVSLFFARSIAIVFQRDGLGAAAGAVLHLLRKVLRYGAWLNAALLAAMLIFALISHSKLYLVFVMIAAANLGNYVMEVVRSGLMAVQRFYHMAALNFCFLGSRFLLAALGIWALGNVTGGMIGVAVAVIPAPLLFLRFFIKADDGRPAPALPHLKTMVPFLGSTTLVAVIMYMDIIVAYLFLTQAQLGVYSSSSILPKAMPAVLMPVIQILFPLLIGHLDQVGSERQVRLKIIKSLGLTTGAALIGAIMLYLISRYLDSSGRLLGIAQSSRELVGILGFSMIFPCALRVLVYAKLALGDDRSPLLIVFFILGFVVWAAATGPDSVELSRGYFWFSAGVFVFYLALVVYSLVFKPGISKVEAVSCARPAVRTEDVE